MPDTQEDALPETPRVTAIVLAGGRSRRMGVAKASLMLDGRTLLQRTVDAVAAVADEIVVARAPGQRLPPLQSARPLRTVEDAVAGEGPLVGIAAGLRSALAPVALLVAGDMPFLRPQLLRLLVERAEAGSRFVIPVREERPQPLCSALRRETLPVVQARLDAGERAVMALADALEAELLAPEAWATADPDGRSFDNVNTPEQLAAAVARLRG